MSIALSVRGPWWWFILHEGKPVENRCWAKRYLALQMGALARAGGVALLHASQGCTKDEYEQACQFAHDACGVRRFPDFETMHRGGLVGRMRLGAFVDRNPSPWFTGPGALVIEHAEPIEFIPCKGELGFFTVNVPEPKLVTHEEAVGKVVTEYHLPRRGRAPKFAEPVEAERELF